jgi:hypothetical protein
MMLVINGHSFFCGEDKAGGLDEVDVSTTLSVVVVFPVTVIMASFPNRINLLCCVSRGRRGAEFRSPAVSFLFRPTQHHSISKHQDVIKAIRRAAAHI